MPINSIDTEFATDREKPKSSRHIFVATRWPSDRFGESTEKVSIARLENAK